MYTENLILVKELFPFPKIFVFRSHAPYTAALMCNFFHLKIINCVKQNFEHLLLSIDNNTILCEKHNIIPLL